MTTHMPIYEDLSGLPRRSGGGRQPDAEPRFGPIVARAWYEAYEAERGEHVTSHKLWASDAGACARALGYRVERRIAEMHNARLEAYLETKAKFPDSTTEDPGFPLEPVEVVPPSNPPSLADKWRMNLGSMVHDVVAKYLPLAFPGATFEIRIEVDDLDLSIRADVLITLEDGRKILLEVKTINGYGFKSAIGVARRGMDAEGPRHNAVLQGALGALEAGADELVIVYLSLELVSKNIGDARGMSETDLFMAEWTFTRDEFEPMARREKDRMAKVLELVEAGQLPPRAIPGPEMPPGARVTNPETGDWEQIVDGQLVNVGTTWMCGYCWERDRCKQDGPS